MKIIFGTVASHLLHYTITFRFIYFNFEESSYACLQKTNLWTLAVKKNRTGKKLQFQNINISKLYWTLANPKTRRRAISLCSSAHASSESSTGLILSRKRGISHAERLARIDCHKVHTISLICNAKIRNQWVNDTLLQVSIFIPEIFRPIE